MNITTCLNYLNAVVIGMVVWMLLTVRKVDNICTAPTTTSDGNGDDHDSIFSSKNNAYPFHQISFKHKHKPQTSDLQYKSFPRKYPKIYHIWEITDYNECKFIVYYKFATVEWCTPPYIWTKDKLWQQENEYKIWDPYMYQYTVF